MDRWRELYDWLEEQISMKDSLAGDPFTSNGLSLECAYEADAMREVRQQMRRKDPSLPVKEADEW